MVEVSFPSFAQAWSRQERRKKMKIKVKVKPHSGEQGVEEKGGYYLVNVKSKAEDNKANVELLKVLKKYLNKEVRIKSGFTSKNKVVEVFD